MDQQAEKDKTERVRALGRRTGEEIANDSPDIPDRGGDIRHPQPPFEFQSINKNKLKAATELGGVGGGGL